MSSTTNVKDAATSVLNNVLHIPKFPSEAAALSYLCRHAQKHVSSASFNETSQFISRSYLLALIDRLISWSMYHEAQTLYAAMKSSQHFTPPPSMIAYFESLSSSTIIEKLVVSATQFEEKHGFVPDEFVAAAFEPFLRSQDHESLERLYKAVRFPSTLASNLYLKSLLQCRHFIQARQLFQHLLDQNEQSKRRLGADPYTFAIYIQHCELLGDVNQVLSLMETLLSRRHGSPGRLHFELVFKALIHARRYRALTAMIEEMLKSDVTEIEEEIAANVVWAMVDCGEHSFGVRFHVALSNKSEFTSVRYFKGVRACLNSTALLPETELEKVEARIKRLQQSNQASDTASTKPKEHHIIDKEASKVLTNFLATKSNYDEFNLRELETLLNANLPHTSISRVWNYMNDHHPDKIPIVLAEQLVSSAETVEQIRSALEDIRELDIASTPAILAHHMRSLSLMAENIHLRSIRPEKLFAEVQRVYNQYTESQGVTPSWDAQRWRLKAMYQLQRGQDAVSTLEKLLPSLSDLLSAPASAFTILPIRPYQASKLAIKRQTARGTLKESTVVDELDPSETQQFRLPSAVAADFYAWSVLMEQSPSQRQEFLKEAEAYADMPAAATLTSSQLRVLLSAVQNACRRPKGHSSTSNGWKTRYYKPSL